MSKQLTIENEDFQKAAATFRKELLRIPIIGAGATLQYLTVRPGVRYEEMVGSISSNAQIAPYKPGRKSDAGVNLDVRGLRTYFGSVNADFEPNSVIQTLLGHMASQSMSDDIANTVSAREVLAAVAKSVSASLNNAIWNAERDPEGSTTATLFDGFDTIAEKEIAAGNLADAKGNYLGIQTITGNNAVDLFKYCVKNMDPALREQDCNMYVSFDMYDAYCDNYALTHGSLHYNTGYDQTFVEGSGNKVRIVPLASKSKSKFIQISPKSNMLFGCDQMSDIESVRVKEFEPDILTLMMRMFAGCQYESIDKSRLLVIKTGVL